MSSSWGYLGAPKHPLSNLECNEPLWLTCKIDRPWYLKKIDSTDTDYNSSALIKYIIKLIHYKLRKFLNNMEFQIKQYKQNYFKFKLEKLYSTLIYVLPFQRLNK